MLIRDSELQEKQKKVDPVLEYRTKAREYAVKELNQGQTLIDNFDPGNFEKQKGRMMWPYELEALIKKLAGDRVQFVNHPSNPTKKVIYERRQDGNDWFVCAYENNLMPEWSVLEVREEWVADPDAVIDRAELKDKGEHAGFKRVQQGWMESVRGWRTVLIRLLWDGVIKIDELERIVGGSDRENWAAKAKRHPDAVAIY